jgi:hypothetical protein
MDNTLILRHQVLPSNAKPNGVYVPFDNVDFSLDFNGRAIVMNSIKVSGRVAPRQSGNKITANDFYYDETIGIHNFFDTISSSTERQGLLESIQEYSRYVGMKADTTMYKTTLGGNLSNTVELKCFDQEVSNALIRLREKNSPSGTGGGIIDDDLSFVMKPDIVFNNAIGQTDPQDVRISYNKTGSLMLSLRVARVNEALFGLGVDADTSFTLNDLKVEFLSVPDENPNNTVITEVKQHVKQTILSERSNLSVRVPMVATSFSASFLPVDEENLTEFNTHRRSAVNELRNLQFLFNNNTMELITYNIDDRAEILRHYLMSMGQGSRNMLEATNNSARKGYGIGLEFEPVDLTNNSFNVNLEAPNFVNNPHIIYGYFKGILVV